MKNLENYGVLEMNAKEITEIDGGGPITDYLIGKAIDLVIEFTFSDMTGYGEWLVETEGSHGAW